MRGHRTKRPRPRPFLTAKSSDNGLGQVVTCHGRHTPLSNGRDRFSGPPFQPWRGRCWACCSRRRLFADHWPWKLPVKTKSQPFGSVLARRNSRGAGNVGDLLAAHRRANRERRPGDDRIDCRPAIHGFLRGPRARDGRRRPSRTDVRLRRRHRQQGAELPVPGRPRGFAATSRRTRARTLYTL